MAVDEIATSGALAAKLPAGLAIMLIVIVMLMFIFRREHWRVNHAQSSMIYDPDPPENHVWNKTTSPLFGMLLKDLDIGCRSGMTS
jgi:hypothetical protein